ncbi:MFS transporter [Bordetella holmesii]|uniref:Transporter, major facilitator family protein n=2 Tax=Bordetella holmesii TaxID=35814 RepID=A0A158M8B8_9BORD|nr:MFS transporter [Bordetella holmesii]KAK67538.1 transporter, major facilitator family protein [Bordetella holmesii H620]KAK79155.1 transporter, major facilitator family protein [Bordetella holmesii CDC-H809-BH]KAK85818.1 transporter, major facilitator family protein [Bordetella holmesii CDC-H572-BH]KAK98256.1 transporter, major facilitator family protein [Bordetella holmesii CDC-H585-BH]KAL03518.1 transporter, major facilitator family protein [Bordetella holmesii CDC-H635-BH]KCV03246.1 tra
MASRSSDRAAARHETPMLLPIVLLSAAGFTILTTEFLIIGLLPPMARELQVTVSQAGLLVSLFAFTVASTGPLLTALAARLERKRLFIGILVLFGLSNVLAAYAPNIWIMAVARFVPALALPVFWSLASATAVEVVGPAHAGRAISMVAFGIVAATVFGIPLGVLISDALGWRAAFGLLAALSFAKALLLAWRFPRLRSPRDGLRLAAQLRIARDPIVLAHVVLSLLVFTGMFTAYTYLADMLERLAGLDARLVGWSMMGFGAIGILGNTLGGRLVDKTPLGATALFTALTAISLAILSLTMRAPLPLALTLGAWGIAQAALFIVCHVRVMKSAPQAPAFAASLNISGANIGIGLGAAVGGNVIDQWGLHALGWFSSLILLAALTLAIALMACTRRRQTTTASCDAAVSQA